MKHIYLCGFMGCGKSTIGKALSKRLSMPYYDLDQLIEQKAGMPIPEIFAAYGEAHFRALESEVLVESGKSEPAVIATGGGIFTNPQNGKLIQSLGIVVFLNTPFSYCYQRIKGDASRPVAVSKSREELFELYQSRVSRYRAFSHLNVVCRGSIKQSVQDVLKALQAAEQTKRS